MLFRSKAINLATKKIEKQLYSDEYIINKKILSFDINNSKIGVDVFVSVYENITGYQNIEEIKKE